MSLSARFSVAVWSFEPPHRHPEGLAEAGVASVESGPDFVFGRTSQDAHALARAYASAGIRLRSIHAPFNEEDLLSAADDAKRQTAVETHRKLVEQAGALGFSIVVVHPGGTVDEAEREPAWAQCRRSLESLVAHAESAGVRLAVENQPPGGLGSDHDGLRRLVDGIASDAVGFCLDTGHAHTVGDVVAAYDLFADRLLNIHMHDNDGTRDMHLQPPYGTIPWSALLDAMDRVPFEDEITLEMVPWRWAGYGWMLRELNALMANHGCAARVPGDGGREYDLLCPACGHYVFQATDGAGRFCRCGH